MSWISVSEKRPEDGQKVLCLIWGCDVFPATYLETKIGGAWFPEVDCIACPDVMDIRRTPYSPKFESDPSHWMPFPEMPKEELQ